MPTSTPWWKEGVVYQLYPRSFADSNGDGLGDLPGITARLDYLVELGVDAVWLSPIYPSPLRDFGYDVADYQAIDPAFGTLADFDALVAGAHARGLRVVLDMVMNHTSSDHPWFVESRSSRQSPKRDWYLWRPGRDGGPPNNWCSVFGGSAWEHDPASGEWYLHLFDPGQPDLNWRNPEVVRAFEDIWRFWLDRGVDGFRLDVAHMLVKHSALPDHPRKLGLRDYDRQHHHHHVNLEETHALWKGFRRLLDAYPGDRMAVGEVDLGGLGAEAYYGSGSDELHLAFNFGLLFVPWSAASFQRVVTGWERRLPEEAWPCWVMSNHDIRRHLSRWAGFGDGDARAKVAAMALLTLRGTPFLYYGEELGMREAFIPRKEIVDPPGRRYWPIYRGRDGCRTPMPWSDAAGVGFTTGKPWMRVGPDAKSHNVEAERRDPSSLLSLYRRLLALRRELGALRQGTFTALDAHPGRVWRYRRELGGEQVVVCLNFSRWRSSAALPEGRWRLRLGTHPRGDETLSGDVALGPNEGVVLQRS